MLDRRELNGDPIIDLFYAELDSYPRKSIAHSITKCKVFKNTHPLETLIIGLSLGQNDHALWFSFQMGTEQFKADLVYRREIIEDALLQLRISWRKRKTKWVQAQPIGPTS